MKENNKNINIEESKENIDLFLNILQIAMKNTGIAIGWDLINKKLVLQDIKTGLFSKVELEKLNKILI